MLAMHHKNYQKLSFFNKKYLSIIARPFYFFNPQTILKNDKKMLHMGHYLKTNYHRLRNNLQN